MAGRILVVSEKNGIRYRVGSTIAVRNVFSGRGLVGLLLLDVNKFWLRSFTDTLSATHIGLVSSHYRLRSFAELSAS